MIEFLNQTVPVFKDWLISKDVLLLKSETITEDTSPSVYQHNQYLMPSGVILLATFRVAKEQQDVGIVTGIEVRSIFHR